MAAAAFGFGSPAFSPAATWGFSPTPFAGPLPGAYQGAQPYSTLPASFGGYGIANTTPWGQSPQQLAQWLQIVPQQLQQVQQLAHIEYQQLQQLQQLVQLLPLHIQQLQHLSHVVPQLAQEVHQLLIAQSQSPLGAGPIGFSGQYGTHPMAPQPFGQTGYVM